MTSIHNSVEARGTHEGGRINGGFEGIVRGEIARQVPADQEDDQSSGLSLVLGIAGYLIMLPGLLAYCSIYPIF